MARLALLLVVVSLTAFAACGSYRYMKPTDDDDGAWTALDASPRGAPTQTTGPSPSAPTTTTQAAAVVSSGRRVAVLELTGGGLDVALLKLLSDGLRAEALKAGRARGMTVMTRESMLAILADMGACTTPEEGSCEVETGRNIGADILVTGDVTKVGAQYFLALKLFDVKSGALLATRTLRARDGVGLVDAIERDGHGLFADGLGDP